MKKLLIPIDFSRASNNAVSYAVALSQHHPLEQIILLVNVYVTEFEQLIPSADFIQYSLNKAAELDSHLKIQFEQLKHSLLYKLNPQVRISFILSKIPFLQSLRNIISRELPDLMLIGSNHGVSGEESYISYHLIKIARTSAIPVLIVPELTHYQAIQRALIPFNLSNISLVNLIRKMSKLRNWPHPGLLFLDVDNTPETTSRDVSDKLKVEIAKSPPEYTCHFYNATEKDVLKGINHFSFNITLTVYRIS